jgi:type IV pilus assembly protein PilB
MVSTTQGLNVRDSLLQILEERRLLNTEQVRLLRSSDITSQEALEREFNGTYGVSQSDIFLALSKHASIPVLRLTHFQIRPELLGKVPKEILKRHRAVPVAETSLTVTVAMADPLNVLAVEEIADYTRLKVVPVAALDAEIQEAMGAIDQGSRQALDDILKDAGETGIEVTKEKAGNVDIEQMLESAGDAPVIRLVNMILMEAIRRRASDIHIEPFEKDVRLRYRVDGNLVEMPSPPKVMQNAIISRIKVMSELDIAERRIPQDGRFRIKAQGREIDLRVSILPTVHGEKVVMRLLDKMNLAKSLDAIGLDAESLEKLRFAISQPHGLILVTGPTGSGKTTTLYSALQELNNPDVNIVTVENPVEYQIQGINQVEIREEVGLTFSGALRSILRQDPDIVLVGETRDNETADIAVKAALTGHLVLTTLHTNDAPGAVARLAYMGIPNFLISSSLLLSQAQRLVRRICPNCKEPFPLTKEYLQTSRIPLDAFEGVEVYHGRGCGKCNNTGYKGRASIMEILPVTSAIRETVLKSANADDIRRVALSEGFKDLRAHGFMRVREGITTIEEVLSVTSGEA